MKRIFVEGDVLNETDLHEVAYVLRNEGVLMHATETCYGLAADYFDDTAMRKVYKIKKMSTDKPVSMMVLNIEEAKKYVLVTDLALELAEKFWPGPLTMILEGINGGTIGLRSPDHALTMQLLKEYKKPLCTTSANLTGKPQAYSVEDFILQKEVGEQPDLILDSGEILKNAPSTIVDLTTENISIVREGDNAKNIKHFLF